MAKIALNPRDLTGKEFKLFTYQMLAGSTYQPSIEYATIEEVRKNKNKILWNILTQNTFHFARKLERAAVTTIPLGAKDGIIVFRVSRLEKVQWYEKETALSHRENSWPPVIVIINNDPAVQTIGIEVTSGKMKAETVMGLVKETLETALAFYGLSVYVNAIFDEQSFWKTVKQYKNKIEKIRFDIVSPNLPRVNQDVKTGLKGLAKEIGADITQLQLNAQKGDILNLEDAKETLKPIVKEASKGGSAVKIKLRDAKGFRNAIKQTRTFSVQEMTLEGESGDIHDLLKNLMRDV